MSDSVQKEKSILAQLNALDRIWNESIDDKDIKTQQLKLQLWITETEAVLEKLGEPRSLAAISRLVSETIDNPKERFYEEVKRLRKSLGK